MLLDDSPLSPGQTRRLCSGMLRHFVDHGVPDERGLLSLGWHHHFLPVTQSYSGPGSPYWASKKGFLGLLLPAEHPVWTDREAALPIDEDDQVPRDARAGLRRAGHSARRDRPAAQPRQRPRAERQAAERRPAERRPRRAPPQSHRPTITTTGSHTRLAPRRRSRPIGSTTTWPSSARVERSATAAGFEGLANRRLRGGTPGCPDTTTRGGSRSPRSSTVASKCAVS